MESKQGLETAPTRYPFTGEELARLSAYKTVVQAGFYTDARAEPGGLENTFTPHELTRPAIYRAAIKAGFYTDVLDEGGDAEARNHPIQ
jgi:hypothetical protein